MKFKDFPYERPNFEKLKTDFNNLIQKFNNSQNIEEQIGIIKEINLLRNEFETMYTLATIRHTVNTLDEFYDQEQKFFDEISPIYYGFITDYYKALLNSKFRDELEKHFGKHLFTIAEFATKTFIPEIVEDLQEENRLTTEYGKLLASAKIMFQGEERNLSQMTPFTQDKDRNMRKQASEVKWNFFKKHEEELDKLYDDLVKVRTKIARKMGYKNFTELGYIRMCRYDYTPEMVSNFRKQVLDYIVPITQKLYERQRERLNLDTLYYYDQNFKFNSGNAKPHGNAEWMVNNAKKMYSELSPETKEYFNFMVDHELMDLESKKGKSGGGYCTFIDKYKAPFIFSNFNGTSGDVDVLTHEAGHAFQAYLAKDFEIREYSSPTLEACEVHSMSMEFITYPWMNLFFEDEADKYKFSHLAAALEFIPYGVSVDEFQHFVYDNPEATPAERKKAWRSIEKKYLPHINYENNEFLENGGYWQQQRHIYESPFYYIDYTLAQICSLQFWKKCQENRNDAWKDYLNYSLEGGKLPFTQLVKKGNLIVPFENGCVKSIVEHIEKYINSIDDSKF